MLLLASISLCAQAAPGSRVNDAALTSQQVRAAPVQLQEYQIQLQSLQPSSHALGRAATQPTQPDVQAARQGEHSLASHSHSHGLQASQLLQLQRQAPDGVIDFDGGRFTQFAVGKRRPYTLIVFMSANHLQDKANLRLTDLRAEFGHAAKAFRKNHQNTSDTGAHTAAAAAPVLGMLTS